MIFFVMTGRLIVPPLPNPFQTDVSVKNIFSSLEDLTLKVRDVKIPPTGVNRSRAWALNASLMLIGASGNLCRLVPAGISGLI